MLDPLAPPVMAPKNARTTSTRTSTPPPAMTCAARRTCRTAGYACSQRYTSARASLSQEIDGRASHRTGASLHVGPRRYDFGLDAGWVGSRSPLSADSLVGWRVAFESSAQLHDPDRTENSRDQ